MVKRLNDIIAVAESLGWDVSREGKYELEFRKSSPAGEDFGFTVESKAVQGLLGEIRVFANEFDTESHVRDVDGMRGAPNLKELIIDAEAIKGMLLDLAEALDSFGKEPSTKKMSYKVIIKETLQKEIVVEGSDEVDSPEAALDWVEEEYHSGRIILDSDDYNGDTTVEVVGASAE